VDAWHPRAAPSAPSAVRWSALPASIRLSVCTGRLASACLLPLADPQRLRWPRGTSGKSDRHLSHGNSLKKCELPMRFT
jgi:hypothetical protein